ncbi:MAG: OpgC domain-containing protein [Hyphomicrobiaceae bacterium]|nr:OpgC domain-containing protein [Hyphomicrobiaceae bacterium]
MRVDNPIDFWRGAALVMIFINHVPGNVFAYFTLRNFAVADAAELFVFLAGWSLFYATGGVERPESARRVWFRLITRAIELYRAQIVISVLALSLFAAVSLWRNNPIYLEWNNAGPAFTDPQRALIGLVTLQYQLGYFDILPLYVVLLVMAPVFILLGRISIPATLALSLAVYGLALWYRIIPPAWPAYERWYFNPFAWQLLIVLGFVAARLSATSASFRHWCGLLVPYAVLILIVGLVLTRYQYFPDPLAVPEPRMFFLFDKAYLSPARLVSVLALIIAFHGVFSRLAPLVPAVTEYLCSLGRNSLAVFCVGSLLSQVGQIIRFWNEGSFLVDLGIVCSGLGLMGLTAWFVEWRERLPPGLARSR